MADQIWEVRLQGIQEVLARPPLNPQLLRQAQITAMRTTSFWMQGQLQRRIPVRTGQTRGRITHRVDTSGNDVLGIVGGKSIAPGGFNILQGLETGTGIYGPRQQRIRPVNARVLSWISGSTPVAGTGGGRVFARSVAGMRPVRPFQRTRQEEGNNARALFARSLSAAIAARRGGA